MERKRIILITILAVLAAIVVLQNTAQVETRLLFFTITAPRAVLLLGTLLIGFAIGVLVTRRYGASHRSS